MITCQGVLLSNPEDIPRREAHIFLEPNRTYAPRLKAIGGFPPTYFHTDEKEIPLEEYYEETILKVESKELADESAYLLLDLKISKNHPIAANIVRRLNARVLAELGENRILVTSTLNDLRSAKSDILRLKMVRDGLFAIRQLDPEEIIDPELETADFEEPRTLTFHLVPNIGPQKAEKYIALTGNYLESNDIRFGPSWIDPDSGNSSLNARVTSSQLLDLVQKAGFLFKVHERMRIHTLEPRTESVPNGLQIEQVDTGQIEALPKICIVDTGVNTIPQLSGLIAKRVAEAPIGSPDDLHNHGTPVASLAIFGDNMYGQSRTLIPLAQVISYKVLSPTNMLDLRASMYKAISQNTDCRTFSCSLCFEGSRLAFELITQRINEIAQRSNRTIVFSAGNIDHDTLSAIASAGQVQYPDYLYHAQVMHPSDAPFVFSVGSSTRYSLPNSIAPANGPSPFTTFGTKLREIRDCPKPELVEHGGNVCCINGRLNCSGIGVKTFSSSGRLIERYGTSLAAPLVAQHMARIWKHFRKNIKNVETVKAILLSTCDPTLNHPRFTGFGDPCKDELFCSRSGVFRVVFEGSLPLTSTIRGSVATPADEIKVFVPADIEKIEVFLVHSDNYRLNAFPRLTTYVRVVAEKPGKKGSVKPIIGKMSSQTYVKHLVYEYKRNIKGDWFFRLVPTMVSIPEEERKNVTIRYGGVIKLTAKTSRFGVGQSVIQGLRRGRRIQIPLNASS